MKKIHFLLSFLFALNALNALNAQIVNIPDANFKARLLSATTTNTIAKDINGNAIKIDTNNDNEIQISEALLIYKLDISSNIYDDLDNIINLTGIDNFRNLIWLNCSGNAINSLNVKYLTKLKYLDASISNIVTLDVSGLVCWDNLF